jgi:cell division protein FtsW
MVSAATQAIRRSPEDVQLDVPEQFDSSLMLAFVTLLGVGLVMVCSATIASDNHSLATNFDYLARHAMHVAAGLLVMTVFIFIPTVFWETVGKAVLLIAMIVLALLLVPGLGTEVNGSTRWFALGPIRVQPAELAKLAMIIYTAGYLTRKQDQLGQFTQGIVMIGLVLGVLALLLLSQPDFGSFVVIATTVGLMMFLGGIRILHMILCVGVAGAALAVMVITSPYRMQRVLSFRDPWADPFDSGFQLVQALIAIGRGEIFGVGLGGSIQKLYYLPHANNDFILAVIGEELGLVGIVLVISLFAVILQRSLAIAKRAEAAGQIYPARLAQGVGLLIVLQAIINMGVNLGVLPTKGLTLPFVSYGGTSMLVCCAAMGLLFAVDRQSRSRIRSRGGGEG